MGMVEVATQRGPLANTHPVGAAWRWGPRFAAAARIGAATPLVMSRRTLSADSHPPRHISICPPPPQPFGPALRPRTAPSPAHRPGPRARRREPSAVDAWFIVVRPTPRTSRGLFIIIIIRRGPSQR
eukprot:scaffold5581_cov229-Prasinococcus_capsulatus_cf.AAC.11